VAAVCHLSSVILNLVMLQVPATPLAPPVELCPAPKGINSRLDVCDSRKRALEAVGELRLTSTAVAAAAAVAPPGAAEEDAERNRKRRGSGSETAAAAAAAAAAAQIAAAAGGLPAGLQDVPMSGAAAVSAAAAAAAATDDDYTAPAAAAAEAAGVGVSAGGGHVQPAPAFVLLGVLSAGRQGNSE
jgi:hypothetical protein